MSSLDAVIDEHEALDFTRACENANFRSDQKQSYFPNLPKTWSEAAVDYSALAARADKVLDKVDLLDGSTNYRSLLFEIGTISKEDIHKHESALPHVIETEKRARAKAREWLSQSDSFHLNSADETIKIHVETTCLALSSEAGSSGSPSSGPQSQTSYPSEVMTKSEPTSNPQIFNSRTPSAGTYSQPPTQSVSPKEPISIPLLNSMKTSHENENFIKTEFPPSPDNHMKEKCLKREDFDQSQREPKVARKSTAERADPELKKLKCHQGGTYRFSMSKLHFSKIMCPYCITSSEVDKHYIRAEYWRRHVTEVHKKQEEVNSTRNLVICLACYEAKLEEGKEQKKNSLPLPDFAALCTTEEQRQHHVSQVHNGQEVQFVSCWDKKEVTNPRRRKVPSTDHSPPKVVSSPVMSPSSLQGSAQPVTQLGLIIDSIN